MRKIEQQVLQRIDKSQNLIELQNVLNQLKPGFGIEHDATYEKSKQNLENCIKNGNFTQIVQQKQQYESLIKNMKMNNQQMAQALEEGQKKIRKIMVVNIDDNSIGKRINSIVDQCLEIDIRGAEAMKRQRLDADASSNTSSNLFNTNAAQLRMQQQMEARKQMEERAKAEQER